MSKSQRVFRKVLAISETNWKRLAKRAEGFETPNSVIERLLDEVDNLKKELKNIIEGK